MVKYYGLNIIYNIWGICNVWFEEIGKWDYFSIECICVNVFCVYEVGKGFYFG